MKEIEVRTIVGEEHWEEFLEWIEESQLCTKCNTVKPLDLFSPNAGGRLGRVSQCKECRRRYADSYYRKNKDKVLEWGRLYKQTPKGKAVAIKTAHNQMAKFPEKWSARTTLKNEVASGRIKRLPCEVCGETKTEGHHDDYSKPLEVRWLCTYHHKQHHYGQVH